MFPALFALLLSLVGGVAHADTRTVCVYDPAGRTGFAYSWLESWKINAPAWGVDVDLRPYTDEETAINDFNAGKCDGVVATGVRLQRFNAAAYSVEALAGIPSYSLLKPVLVTLQTKSSYAPMFTSGLYETAGIYPLGAVYAFVRDRSIDDVGDFAGRRIATMDYDNTSKLVVDRIGGVMVPADLSSLGPMFNNGDVDVCFLPATAYTPFELWHGLGDGGAAVKYPLLQVTLQIVLNAERFPADFGKQSRAFVAGQFDEAMTVVERAEAEIPSTSWTTMPPDKVAEFEVLMQRLRIELRDKGSYSGEVLSLLRKARCNADGTRAECAQGLE